MVRARAHRRRARHPAAATGTKVQGGDGTWVVPNPRDPQTVWSAAGGGDNQGAVARFDRRTASQFDVSPYERDQNVVAPTRLAYRFNWETPIAFDPFDPRAVYVGGNVLFRSTDDGMHWTAISPDLTRNLKERQTLSGGPLTLDVTGAETFDTILAVAPSTVAARTIWIATDDGVVQLTRDARRALAQRLDPGRRRRRPHPRHRTVAFQRRHGVRGRRPPLRGRPRAVRVRHATISARRGARS